VRELCGTVRGVAELRIFGRSSSVFTRCASLFAQELGVPYQLRVVTDLLSQARADYGDNPALKMPTLETESDTWFGALNICRELARRAGRTVSVVWPEDLRDATAANAQELVLQGMVTEVTLIMGSLPNEANTSAFQSKNRIALQNILQWLDERLPQVLAQLPEARSISFFEVTLFCFITHLEFRRVFDASGFARLAGFCAEFGQRVAARATPYRFD
jgi:glutathione S-transferase